MANMKLSAAIAFVVFACTAFGRAIYVVNAAVNSTSEKLNVLHSPLTWLPPATGFNPSYQADDPEFEKFTCKGSNLLTGLTSSDLSAGKLLHDTRNPPSAASEFSGDLQSELKQWYWHDVTDDWLQETCDFDGFYREIPNAMRGLGLNGKPANEGGDNFCWRVEHWDKERKDGQGRRVEARDQEYWVEGKGYKATKAHYEFGVNVKGGAIIALELLGPAHSAAKEWRQNQQDVDKNALPKLSRLSDILWGYWNRNNPNVKNINYFFALEIANMETNRVIARVLGNTALAPWPGTKFSTSSDQGKALLGSPNGATFGYFLMQRKAELGIKSITDVTVFRKENDDPVDVSDPSLVFHVEDAEEEDGGL